MEPSQQTVITWCNMALLGRCLLVVGGGCIPSQPSLLVVGGGPPYGCREETDHHPGEV